MIAATVSSFDLNSVGPNTTPKLPAAIRFCFECAPTLKGHRMKDTVKQREYDWE